MFTGLVQTTAALIGREETHAGARLLIDADHWNHRPELGDSIAVDGVCLTLANRAGQNRLAFDVINETLDKTTFAEIHPGRLVNLEHALRAGDAIGGHFVQGHVEHTAQVTHVQNQPQDWRLTIEPPPDLAPYIIEKGSITLQGVSLTVARTIPAGPGPPITPFRFEVALIPTTLDETTLDELAPADRINIETDMLTKAVVNTVRDILAERASH